MRLAELVLAFVALTATVFHVASATQSNLRAPKAEQSLHVEPGRDVNRSAAPGEKKEDSTSSCEKENSFEDVLDKLAFALFVEPPVNPSSDVNYVRRMLEGFPLGEIPKGADPEILKAAATRLQGWWNAALRVQHSKGHKTETASASAGQSVVAKEIVNKTEKSSHETHGETEVAEQRRTLPTACTVSLSGTDPYWAQKDSYWVCSNGKCEPYNECRFSNGCKRVYTNYQRVVSLRRTLDATHKLLNLFGVTHMLFGGSVIGAYRCKDVLPWDLDTDVAVLNEHLPQLFNIIAAGQPGTGYKNQGRSIDLALYGVPGYTLMEKIPGCIPLVVVDQATGFFTDIFPMQPTPSNVPLHMFSPWWNGKTTCDAAAMFNGCTNKRCDYWSYSKTLPPSVCQIEQTLQFCAGDLRGFLYEYYGRSVDHPDRPVRSAAAAFLAPAPK